jgi:hypothetical protein
LRTSGSWPLLPRYSFFWAINLAYSAI